jgi:hypothetical protein
VAITIDQIVPDIDLATDSQIKNGNADIREQNRSFHGLGKKRYISVPVTCKT